MDMRVYVLITSEYSDYHIVGVTLDKNDLAGDKFGTI